ncbi:MAG: hypothetical protein JXX28_18175 [Deltaproteobacteria bacterium]|nr:hypothetical protein [Deltaproteobacteria bacterium]
MDFLKNLGRTEWLIAGGVVALLVLITIPLMLTGSKKTGRAELPLMVDAIRTAEITYRDAYGDYVGSPATPRPVAALDAEPAAWVSTPGFTKLHWSPPTEQVYGSYEVQVTPEGFTVIGRADLDGDGIVAVYKATQDKNAFRVTGEDVY